MAKITDKQREALIAMSLEVNDDGKPKYKQQELADKFGISKGMVSRYVSAKKEISKQIVDDEARILGELEKIELKKSKHLSKQEQIEVNKQVRSKLELNRKTENIAVGFQDMILARQNATNMLIQKVNDYLAQELDKAENEDEVQKLYDAYNTKMETIINYNEVRTGIEANDRAAVTLKVADRHAPKIDVTQNQALLPSVNYYAPMKDEDK